MRWRVFLLLIFSCFSFASLLIILLRGSRRTHVDGAGGEGLRMGREFSEVCVQRASLLRSRWYVLTHTPRTPLHTHDIPRTHHTSSCAPSCACHLARMSHISPVRLATSQETKYNTSDKYMWFKKKGMGSVPAARASHAATLMADKWLIFGGRISFVLPLLLPPLSRLLFFYLSCFFFDGGVSSGGWQDSNE